MRSGDRSRLVRRAVVVVCAASIAGMIVASIADESHAAVAFGLIAASTVTTLLAVTAVAAPAGEPSDRSGGSVDELGSAIEDEIRVLAAGGHDESTLRGLVGRAVRLGRVIERAEADPTRPDAPSTTDRGR